MNVMFSQGMMSLTETIFFNAARDGIVIFEQSHHARDFLFRWLKLLEEEDTGSKRVKQSVSNCNI